VCQYQSKGACTLGELGLADPRDSSPTLDDWDGLKGFTSPVDVPRASGLRLQFDPDLEHLIASARIGGFISTIRNEELLSRLAQILEKALPTPSP
jgi:hypothetical protein